MAADDDTDPVPAAATDITVPFAAVPVAGPGGSWGADGPAPVPPRRRRISRRAKVAFLAGAVTAALIAGLAVWSPWRPNPPTGVRATSPTATSVVVSWHASSGDTVSPGNYLVLRGGRQVASVPAGTTSWTDHGLAPGATYHYTVIAAGLGHSAPSAPAAVTTITPSPVRLTAHPTHTTVTLHWSPPPLAPTPGEYVISNGTAVVATLPGTTTSYTAKAQSPGTSFKYTVVAQWGNYLSGPSAAASGATIAAPLSSDVPVHVNTTGSPGASWGPIVVGYHWDDTWRAAPVCNPGDCPVMTMRISVGPAGTYQNASFPVRLHSYGTGYSGTATAKVTGCKTSMSVIPYTNTVTVTLTPTKGKVENGAWTAWTGTMTMTAPYMNEGGGYYCPSGTWTFALTSRLSRRQPPAPRPDGQDPGPSVIDEARALPVPSGSREPVPPARLVPLQTGQPCRSVRQALRQGARVRARPGSRQTVPAAAETPRVRRRLSGTVPVRFRRALTASGLAASGEHRPRTTGSIWGRQELFKAGRYARYMSYVLDVRIS